MADKLNSLIIKENIDYNKNPKLLFYIPYRNRLENLEITIFKLKEYINYNKLKADIVILEQSNLGSWNKGFLVNCLLDIYKDIYDFYIMFDADTYIVDYNYKLILDEKYISHILGHVHCLGGIFSLTYKQFSKINGFSNNFNNWGREDSDLHTRAKKYYEIKLFNTIDYSKKWKDIFKIDEHDICFHIVKNDDSFYKKAFDINKSIKKHFYFKDIKYTDDINDIFKNSIINIMYNHKDFKFLGLNIIDNKLFYNNNTYEVNNLIKLDIKNSNIIIENDTKNITLNFDIKNYLINNQYIITNEKCILYHNYDNFYYTFERYYKNVKNEKFKTLKIFF